MQILDELGLKIYNSKLVQAKKIMIKNILRYSKNIKRGLVMFPPALTVLSQIRNDRRQNLKDLNLLFEKA